MNVTFGIAAIVEHESDWSGGTGDFARHVT